MEQCTHEGTKVYSERKLLTYPSQTKWICAKCGHKDVAIGIVNRGPTYEELVEKFERKE